MILHRLDGCAPAPLAHYLKALGILRIVSEQSDAQTRGWWEGERFFLASRLDSEELFEFFLNRYEPTPFVAPWNKGSGFFYSNDPSLTPIEHSSAPRFKKLRDAIAASRSLLTELSSADQAVRVIKEEAKQKHLTKAQRAALRKDEAYRRRLYEAERRFKQLKSDLIPRCRLIWRGPHREWMDAAIVLDDRGEPRFPALFGTGGNDGRLDFTNNYFRWLNEVFAVETESGSARPVARDWFQNALFGTPTNKYRSGAVGQYAPGAAGGANSTVGVDGGSLLNPVDFILTLEGSVLFSAHATRRFGSVLPSRAAAPFAVSAQGSGYASAADTDESARGEQWMPLWPQPTTLQELRRLLAEGRAQIGARSVSEPLDMARAVSSLGTVRGITAFQRYAFIERNGRSNLAVPLGRFFVPDKASPRLECLNDIDTWLIRLRRAARDQGAAARLKVAERNLSDGLFAVVQHPDEPLRWQNVVLALADVEAVLLRSNNVRCGPVPPLRPEWICTGDDGSAEWRLAVSLALQARRFQSDGTPIDRVRRHWVPENNNEAAAVMQGRRGIDDAMALVKRRLIEASQEGVRRLPLVAAYRADASLSDLTGLLGGEVDIDRTLSFARALMAVSGRALANCLQTMQRPPLERWPDEGWLAIRLAMLPWPVGDERFVGTDPAILRRLESGDAPTAIQLALRRLRAAGVASTLRFGSVSSEVARVWAAALAFPISRPTAKRMLYRLSPQSALALENDQ